MSDYVKKTIELGERLKKTEKELLSALFFDERQIGTAIKKLTPDSFRTYRKEYKIFADSFANQKDLMYELALGNADDSVQMHDIIKLDPRQVEILCNEIIELNSALTLTEIFQRGVIDMPSRDIKKYIADVQKKIFTSVRETNDEKDIVKIIEEFKEKQKENKEKYLAGNKIIGISTGYDKLDAVIDGFRPEHLWVVGAYTNMGKTAASLNLTSSLVKQGRRVVFYSLEMGTNDVLARLLGIMTSQKSLCILKDMPHDTEAVVKALDDIGKSGLALKSYTNDLTELLYSIYEEENKQHIDLVVIDFLQLVNVRGTNSEYESTTQAILEMQKIAKKIKSTILVLSQVSNESVRNESPIMGFKGSGGIAGAADIAIEIKRSESQSREDYKKAVQDGLEVGMIWDVRKNRHGRVGNLDMLFSGGTGVFRSDNLLEKSFNN